MRIVIVLVLVLSACTSHDVRCDKHLLRINAPATSAAIEPSRPTAARGKAP